VPDLPRVSGREAVRAFQQAGWEVARQHGSHVVLVRSGCIYWLSIPLHFILGPGLLHDLICKVGLSVEEFADLLRMK
jgi:predicted RNA binding protein YcfA (HicA-like mRNA interferase family)